MARTQAERRAFRSLLRVMLKGEDRSEFSLGAGLGANAKAKKRRRWSSQISGALKWVLIAIPFLFLAGLMAYGTYHLAAVALITLPQLFTSLIFSLLILTLLFGLFSVVSYLYYAKDIPFYLSLPYSASEVMLAKFIQFLGLSGFTNFLFLPAIISFAYARGATIPQLIVYGLSFLMMAFSIDLFFTLIMVLLMRFSKFAHNQERFITVFSILTMVFSLGLGVGMQFFFQGAGGMGRFSSVLQFLSGSVASLILTIIAPQLLFMPWLFSANLLKMLMGFVGIIAVTGLYLWLLSEVAKRYYLPGVMSVQMGSSGTSRQIKRGELGRLVKRRSLQRALQSNDLIKFRRTPIFMTQVLLAPLMMPVYMIAIFAVVFFLNLKNEIASGGFKETYEMIRLVASQLLPSDPYFNWILVAVLAWTVFTGINLAHAMRLAVSMDGEDYFFYKALPLSSRQYLRAKFPTLFAVNYLPQLLLVLILGLLVGLHPLSFLILLLLQLLTNLSVAWLMLGLGAMKPTLNWDNETRLLKGGKNFFWVYAEMLIIAALFAPIVVFIYYNQKQFHLSQSLALGAVGLWLLLGLVLSYLFCFHIGAKKLAKIEN